MRLLDLFCGAGGAAVGYYRAGFTDIVGLDNRPMPRYPFTFVQADALEYLAEHGREFDVIHASPPCQAYTGMRRLTLSRFGVCHTKHPDLIAVTRKALIETDRPYLIENVQGAPLQTQVILCGAAFGLAHLARHRHFECSLLLPNPPQCAHYGNEYTLCVIGNRPDGRRVSYRQHRLCRVPHSLAEAGAAMGIDWMTWDEIREALPPAYTEWIGRRLIEALVTV